MTDLKSENNLTTSMNWRFPVLMASMVLMAALGSVDGQVNGPSECARAREWHLQEALKWSAHGEQDFHLGAAQAAKELAADNAPCNGWVSDAGPQRQLTGPQWDASRGEFQQVAP